MNVRRSGFFSSRVLIPVGLFLTTFILVAATAGDYGVAWDEPSYFHASDLHVEWLADFGSNLARGSPRDSLQDDTIKAAWRWNPYNVPHPPFSRIVSGATKSVAYPWLDKFVAYRLGPALFFALLVACMYLWMTELFGVATGIFAAVTLLTIPNLFAFAHIAVTDMPLASMWFLTAYCFWKGLKSWKWSVALGIVWGLALATKFPALLIPVPLILWAHLFHRGSYANNVFAMLFLSPIFMAASQPYLWHQGGLRILEFLYEGLSRGYRPETSFAVFFFGQNYLSSQLPWYYPFFMIGVTTPEPMLALALVGFLCMPWLREKKATVALFFISAAFIPLMALLPGAVLHDGMRQLLPSLPFLAALAATGFFFLVSHLKNWSARLQSLQAIANLRHKVVAVAMLLTLFVPTLDTYLSHPFQLSYYNRLVGGIQGAYHRGLEVTYFMEAFTPVLLRQLNEQLPPRAVLNASSANFMLEFYQKEGRLRPDITITNNDSFEYYVLLNRRSILSPREHGLLELAKPAMRIDIAGIPLVAVFRRAP